MIISVDPGKKVAGVAIFEDRELSSAWLARGSTWIETTQRIYDGVSSRYPIEVLDHAVWVIEIPQIYSPSRSKGDPNDLLCLTLVAGGLAAKAGEEDRVVLLRPAEWGGQVPKSVKNRRARDKLSLDERERVELPARSLAHNVWDAVGIGLYYLRRR